MINKILNCFCRHKWVIIEKGFYKNITTHTDCLESKVKRGMVIIQVCKKCGAIRRTNL